MSSQSKYRADVSAGPGAPRIARRVFLSGATAVWGTAHAVPTATPAPLAAVDLTVPGFSAGFDQVRVLIPPVEVARRRGLVLLHGLGETREASLALRAWSDLYGATAADERLRHPPMSPLLPRQAYWRPELLGQVNAELASEAYRGAVLVCPRTPNPSLAGNRDRLFERYAAWLVESVLPKVTRQVNEQDGLLIERWGLDGCSLGGYVAMEVFIRRAAFFRSFGCVQGALGEARVPRYAKRLAELSGAVPELALRVASSEGDPYLGLNRDLSRRLTALSVAHTLDVDPGPHNQPWLRDVGTPRMLLWHDRQLHR